VAILSLCFMREGEKPKPDSERILPNFSFIEFR